MAYTPEENGKQNQYTKQRIRQQITSLKKRLPAEEWKERSARIKERLCGLSVWQKSRHVALYHSVNQEVNTVPLIEEGWRQGKTIYLPKCNPQTRQLTFYKVDTFDDLEAVYFGIPEPVPERCTPMDVDRLQCLIVPGVAFDREGYRIGYGAGYYDRYLATLSPAVAKVSLAFQFQVLNHPLPREPFDQPVDVIITEGELIDCQGGAYHVP
ncbi:5-formyltetrahydrofolate cyclo-ligase [Caldalkalibacillus thermarum TA2.A1]|uniref:5-formyltetrahydrofolate cyclo-ligase n=1 Tax=Caldalkalibacillus thermarum (strain TA2.A1) TaxID=986075 RepID=F5LAH8_CALTT|nr:5-formyltetrahydrofolate cyclo-ligase [Caldalkalibacillus thermarum]EGL81727.1 5-formyltetrahydrofolate cyclo-ligase [Caldalkalibacillus thermarum TA2.A1]